MSDDYFGDSDLESQYEDRYTDYQDEEFFDDEYLFDEFCPECGRRLDTPYDECHVCGWEYEAN